MSDVNQGVSIEYAKKKMKWAIIPISKLPVKSPVIGIIEYHSKELAEFHLCEEVIVPIFENEKTASYADIETALKDCIERMDRARGILKNDNANWGMLETDSVKNILTK